MKPVQFGALLILTSGLMCVWATVGGQYSVNVHFVPPLVSGSCQVAQFWNPPNVTCALCFCMTGSISRCIPQPGCNPNNQTSTTITPSSTTDDLSSTSPASNGSPTTAAASVTQATPVTEAATTMSNFV